jgi:hypothetical protein
MGMMLDSTDMVRKNQSIPKEVKWYFLNSKTPVAKIPSNREKLKNVFNWKNPVES